MKLLYFVPVLAMISTGGFAYAESDPIPTWVKNNTELWLSGLIDDQTFKVGIEYLIIEGIVEDNYNGQPITTYMISDSMASELSDNTHNDEIFKKIIQYLVTSGFMEATHTSGADNYWDEEWEEFLDAQNGWAAEYTSESDPAAFHDYLDTQCYFLSQQPNKANDPRFNYQSMCVDRVKSLESNRSSQANNEQSTINPIVTENTNGHVSNTEDIEPIPSWVKETALDWGQSRLSDAEFIDAIEFLITNGIITVDQQYVRELEEEIQDQNKRILELEETIYDLREELEETTNHINNEPETTPPNGTIGDSPPVSPLPDQASVSNADAEVQFAVGSTNPSCADTNDCFVPYEVTVDVGGEVTWSNPDNLSTQSLHTLTSGEITDDTTGDMFNNVLVQPGQTFSYKFEEAGIYPYFCFIHPWMVGTVVVIDDSVEAIAVPD